MREKSKQTMTENNIRLIMLLLVFLAGAFLGGFFSGEHSAKIGEFRTNASFFDICLSGLCGNVLLCAAFFLLGFSSVSLPLEIFLAFFAGQGTGNIMAAAFAECGLFFALTMLPGQAVYALSAALGARESARMSGAVFKRTFLPDEYTPADIRLYILKFAAIAAIGLSAALLDAFSALLFR